MAIAILGILIIIAVIGIKFMGGDEFMGIGNPEGTYGMYFWLGLIIGMIVLLIGAAMSMRKEEKVTEEEAFEEEMTMEEEYGRGEEGEIYSEEETSMEEEYEEEEEEEMFTDEDILEDTE